MQVRRRSSSRHPFKRIVSAAVAALLATAPFASLSATAATSGSGDSGDPAAAVSSSFAPEQSGISTPGQGLVISGAVTNSGSSSTPAGTVIFSIDPRVADETALQDGFTDPATVDGVEIGRIDAPPLTVAGSAQLTAVIPSDVLDPILAGTGWGAHLLVAEYQADGAAASNASAVVRLDGAGPAPLTAAVVLPITVSPSTEGLLGVEELELLTSPSGALTQRLEAVTDPRIVLAIDPRIVASIRVLGSRAPDSATAWLAQLAALTNEKFPLQYADADPSLELSAGSGGLLVPTSFAAALDPADFVSSTPTPSPSDTTGATPAPTADTPTPSPSPTETSAVPTIEEILDFPYTRTDIAWSPAGSATASTVAGIAAAGYSTQLLPESQLAEPAGARVTVGDTTALVADDLSSPVSDAVYAVGANSGRLAVSRAAALTAAATSRPGSDRGVVLALDRGRSSGTSIPERLSALLTLPWMSVAGLSDVGSSAPSPATLVDAGPDRANQAAPLFGDAAAIDAFSSILVQPELLTGTTRLDLLASLSAGWAEDPTAWSAAVSQQRADNAAILNSVSIDDSSPINFASYSAGLPVNVSNALPYPVTVTVVPRASNGRLTVESNSVTIDPESTGRVQLSAEALSNGRVTVSLQLLSPTGIPIGGAKDVQLQLAPFLESVALVVFGVVVVGLLGFGTFRSIRRGRKARAAETTSGA